MIIAMERDMELRMKRRLCTTQCVGGNELTYACY